MVGGGYVVVDLGGGRKGLAEMTPDTTSDSLRAAINESLANGGPVSKAVSREFVNGRFVALGDETRYHDLVSGSGAGVGVADQGLESLLRRFDRDSLLLVEDDLARPGDPDLGGGVVYCGAVVHLGRLGTLSEPGAFLRHGSSGYPLNAFLLFPFDTSSMVGAWEMLSPEVLSASVKMVLTSINDGERFAAVLLVSVTLENCAFVPVEK